MTRRSPVALAYAYPEDVAISGPQATADLLERLGFDGIMLAINYHPARRLMPRHRTVAHAPSGARWLTPGDGYPEALHPNRTGDDATERAVHALRAQCSSRGLAFHAWLVVLHNGALVAARPHLAATTLDGTPTTHALCPAWPDSRAYAAALVEDVCVQLEPDGLELEAALPSGWAPSYVVSLELAPLSGIDRALAGVCVCPGCRDRLHGLAADPEQSIADARQGGQPPALLALRRQLASLALDAIAAPARRHGTPARALLFGDPEDLRWQGATGETLAAMEGVGVGLGTASGDELLRAIASFAQITGDRPMMASINWSPERSPERLEADVRAAMHAGVRAVGLYNLSLTPERGLPALAAAARSASLAAARTRAGAA